ncbi:hypothetical protein AB7783_26565 [Tardiphaga sp. 172_B4_N1_3]|uniref:hypothetical protein n=1 Tax=Tardiphaga sp. 172_B4_N1_3 TaxID=3240787 RepID=UPI003F8CA115
MKTNGLQWEAFRSTEMRRAGQFFMALETLRAVSRRQSATPARDKGLQRPCDLQLDLAKPLAWTPRITNVDRIFG